MMINKIKELGDYIIKNLDVERIEIYEFLWLKFNDIIEKTSIINDELELLLDSRESTEYLQLINNLMKIKNRYIKVEEKTPYFYLYLLERIDRDKKERILNKLEKILNKNNPTNKGFLYEDIVLEFLKAEGVKIYEKKKTNDGGLDIIGIQNINIIDNYDINIFIYGQIKCHNRPIGSRYLKMLIKDYIYRLIDVGEVVAGCKQAMFISHLGFTDNAVKYAERYNIILLTTEDIITTIIRNNKHMNLIKKYFL